MPPEDLDELALSVADGAVIDWNRAIDGSGTPAEVAALRLIEAIAAGHRVDPTTRDTA